MSKSKKSRIPDEIRLRPRGTPLPPTRVIATRRDKLSRRQRLNAVCRDYY